MKIGIGNHKVTENREKKTAPALKQRESRENREIQDSSVISKAALKSAVGHEEAVALMSRVSSRAMNIHSEGTVYLPFVEKPRVEKARTNPLAKKLLGETKVVSKAKTVQVNFKQAVSLLEKGENVLMKPFKWAIKDTGYGLHGFELLAVDPDPWGDENQEFRVSDLGGLKNFLRQTGQEGKAAESEPEIAPKTLLKGWEKEHQELIKSTNEAWGDTCGAAFLPFKKIGKKVENLSFVEAFKQLETNRQNQAAEPVYFQPVLCYSIEDRKAYRKDEFNCVLTKQIHPQATNAPLGECKGGGNAIKPTKIRNFQDLREFYRLINGK